MGITSHSKERESHNAMNWEREREREKMLREDGF